MTIRRWAFLAAAWLFAACSPGDEQRLGPDAAGDAEEPRPAQPHPIWFTGTVHQLPDSGGVWVIRTAGGTQYRPLGLPAEFMVEGLRVDVEARKHDDAIAKDSLGQAIDIVEVHSREGQPREEPPPGG